MKGSGRRTAPQIPGQMDPQYKRTTSAVKMDSSSSSDEYILN